MLDYKREILRARGIDFDEVYKWDKFKRMYYDLIFTDFNENGDIKEIGEISCFQRQDIVMVSKKIV